MESYGDLRSISGYTESLGESNQFQRLLKQSSTISTSAEGLNIFVFVFSNYTVLFMKVKQFFAFTGLEDEKREGAYIFKSIYAKLDSWTVFID